MTFKKDRSFSLDVAGVFLLLGPHSLHPTLLHLALQSLLDELQLLRPLHDRLETRLHLNPHLPLPLPPLLLATRLLLLRLVQLHLITVLLLLALVPRPLRGVTGALHPCRCCHHIIVDLPLLLILLTCMYLLYDVCEVFLGNLKDTDGSRSLIYRNLSVMRSKLVLSGVSSSSSPNLLFTYKLIIFSISGLPFCILYTQSKIFLITLSLPTASCTRYLLS